MKKPMSFFKLSLISILALLGSVLLFSFLGSWHVSPNFAQIPEETPEVERTENPDYVRLDVTPSNVQSVVRELARPAEYYVESKSSLFYDGKTVTYPRRRWVKNSVSRVDIYNYYGNLTMSAIIDAENAYYWYGGASRYITLPKGNFDAENEQMMMDYTDLLELPSHAIKNAYLVRYEGETCIYTEALRDDGTVEKYWISVNDGLLRQGQMLRENEVVYSFLQMKLDVAPQNDDYFTLPDRTVVK